MKNRNDSNPKTDLRQRAERYLAEKAPQNSKKPQYRLVSELQVYQVELEMQNEALRESHASIEAILDRYTELFDYAPLAYFILSEDGCIQQTNFGGENILADDRQSLIGQSFARYVSSQCQSVFSDFLNRVFSNMGKQSCEISLQVAKGKYWVAIEATLDHATYKTCLTAVWDISERKRHEQELLLAAGGCPEFCVNGIVSG